MIKLKKILISLLIILSFFITGCSEEEVVQNNEPIVQKESVLDDIDSSGTGNLFCTRDAFANEGIDVELSYDISYKDGYVMVLHANEKVVSENSDSLDEYENAYRKIAKNYEGLKYYDITITRDKTSVINDTVINYEKIDTDKLLDIEGEEDNVIVDGKVKLSTWVSFAEQFGASCKEVE